MKLLFLDSNIFLSFYSFESEDLDQLKKLISSIKNNEIKLYLTDQVFNEFRKNRDTKVAEAYHKFIESKVSIQMPSICKPYLQYSQISRLQRLLTKTQSELKEKLLIDMRKESLKADIIIEELFKVSEKIKSDEMLGKAIIRHRLGKPPGKKNNSYGDEINWEALLEKVSNEGDFILISKDGDFKGALDDTSIHGFLAKEWNSKKLNKIYFYKTLGDFFRNHHNQIQLQEEDKKEELIESLINSGSFLTTHEIIRNLSKFNSFSEEKIKGLATALLGNSQVKWIAGDGDVRSFYTNHLSDKSDLFEEEVWMEISGLIFDEKETISKTIDEIFATQNEIIPESQNKDGVTDEIEF